MELDGLQGAVDAVAKTGRRVLCPKPDGTVNITAGVNATIRFNKTNELAVRPATGIHNLGCSLVFALAGGKDHAADIIRVLFPIVVLITIVERIAIVLDLRWLIAPPLLDALIDSVPNLIDD